MSGNVIFKGTATIKIDLNKKDFKKDIKKAKDFPIVWDRGLKRGIEYFVDRLVAKFEENIAEAGLGELLTDVSVKVTSKYVKIELSNPEDSKAIYLEYGTGLTGASSPHPKMPDGWEYNSGQHILPSGNWWYPDDDPYPQQRTFISSQTGQQYALTVNQGQVGRRFVYKTWLWGTRQAKKMIGSQIRKEINEYYGGGK